MKNNTKWSLCLVALAFALPGCKKQWGAGCKKSSSMSGPWTELSLPVDESKTRVCESSSDALKLRSYEWSTVDSAQSAFESSLTAAGWAKDRCSDKACYYDKDGYQVSVQPSEFKIKRKKLVTVQLRHRKDPTQKT